MALHLAEIALAVAPGAHALVLARSGRMAWLDEASVVPANITLLPLPPKSPELNPVENIWQFMRDNWLSNRDLRNPTTTSSITVASPGTGSSTALEHHVHRKTKLGTSVMIIGIWYYRLSRLKQDRVVKRLDKTQRTQASGD